MSALRFNSMHFMPYAHLPENHKELQIGLGGFLQQKLRSGQGLRPLSALHQGTGARRSARLRRHRRQRASQHRVQHDGGARISSLRLLIPQTRNARICVWGTPPNFMLPNRLAEEYAMLDVMSGGRLEVAFPLGTGMEYWANPINPATARERFRESLKIILQAWREDGPTTHYGQHYTYRFLNPWPRPKQRPLSAMLHRRHRQPGDHRDRRRASASATRRCSSPRSAARS